MRRRHAMMLMGAGCLAGCAGPASEPDTPPAAGSDRAFSHQVTTTASAAAIWALWTDVEGWPRWDTELKRASLRDPIGLGAQGKLVPKRGVAETFEISLWEPQNAYAFTTRLPGAELVVTRTLLPGEETMFEHQVTFGGARADRWARRLGPDFRRALPEVMASLARLAEQGAT